MFGKFKYWLLAIYKRKVDQRTKSQLKNLAGAAFSFRLKSQLFNGLQTRFFGCLTNQQVKNQKPTKKS